ncbi:MAG: hypothetical protein AAFU85_25125 [Planctomycetota bacterium]
MRLSLTLCVLLLAPPALANNSYFTPGDAFFYSEIDQSEWGKLQDGSLTVLKYDRPEHLSFAFCGYSGCENLDIRTLPESFRKNLIDAIETMKKTYPSKTVTREDPKGGFFGAPPEKEKVERNKIRVFVYDRSFDFSKHRIALKYNEDWPRWAKDRGYQSNHFKYDFFVATPNAIAESWHHGIDVAPLQVNLPIPQRGYMEEPVVADASKIKILVAPPIKLGSLAYPVGAETHFCLVVTENSVQRLTVDFTTHPKGRWKPTTE